MKIVPAFISMLALAAVGAVAVLRLSQPSTIAITVSPETPAPATRSLVLAGHPATYALAHALAVRTSLYVAPAWPAGTPWAEQAEYARQPSVDWLAVAQRATAVITLRQAVRGDALFAAVRVRQPRIVELDASVGADQQMPSVRLRTDAAPGPGFALSPTNAMRLAERLAADFTALHPTDAAVVAENLRAVKERLLRLKAKHEQAFTAVAAPEVAAFTGEFDYLCEDFGVQLVERFEKDFAQWTERERAENLARLQRAGVRVSLHAFAPGASLAAFLAQAKVTPVILDPLTRTVVGPEVYFTQLEANLTTLRAALGP